MKTFLMLALLLISFASSTEWSQQKPQQNILVISEVTVIDATGTPAKPNMTVIITGDQITEIAAAQPQRDFTASSGTATDGSDFTATSGTLIFAAGETIKTFTVPILDDSLDENAESVTLTLSNPTGFTLGARNSTLLTINDNDPMPLMSFSDATVAEGDSGFVDAQFRLSLNRPSGRTLSVRFGAFSGTGAIPTVDFEPVFSRTITFKSWRNNQDGYGASYWRHVC